MAPAEQERAAVPFVLSSPLLAEEAFAAEVNRNSRGDAFLKDGRTHGGVHMLMKARKVNGALQQELEFLFEVHRRGGYEGVMAPMH